MKYYGISDKGKVREQNQDCIYIPTDKDINLYIIADGMGGANAGDVASKQAIEHIKKYIYEHYIPEGDNKIKQVIKDALIYANKEVYNMSIQDENLNGMGTTVITY